MYYFQIQPRCVTGLRFQAQERDMADENDTSRQYISHRTKYISINHPIIHVSPSPRTRFENHAPIGQECAQPAANICHHFSDSCC